MNSLKVIPLIVLGAGAAWQYHVFLSTLAGKPLGQFTCGPKETKERLKALPTSGQ